MKETNSTFPPSLPDPYTDLASTTFTTNNNGLVPGFQISFDFTKRFLSNSKYMRWKLLN